MPHVGTLVAASWWSRGVTSPKPLLIDHGTTADGGCLFSDPVTLDAWVSMRFIGTYPAVEGGERGVPVAGPIQSPTTWTATVADG